MSNPTENWDYRIWKNGLQNGLKCILRDIEIKKKSGEGQTPKVRAFGFQCPFPPPPPPPINPSVSSHENNSRFLGKTGENPIYVRGTREQVPPTLPPTGRPPKCDETNDENLPVFPTILLQILTLSNQMSCYKIEFIRSKLNNQDKQLPVCRIMSCNFGHQLYSDIQLQKVNTQMRRCLMRRLIRTSMFAL